MKEIIKHGKPPKDESIKTFICCVCKCEFRCGLDEYECFEHYRVEYRSTCPECGNTSYEPVNR